MQTGKEKDCGLRSPTACSPKNANDPLRTTSACPAASALALWAHTADHDAAVSALVLSWEIQLPCGAAMTTVGASQEKGATIQNREEMHKDREVAPTTGTSSRRHNGLSTTTRDIQAEEHQQAEQEQVLTTGRVGCGARHCATTRLPAWETTLGLRYTPERQVLAAQACWANKIQEQAAGSDGSRGAESDKQSMRLSAQRRRWRRRRPGLLVCYNSQRNGL
ncbi:hypothetical protein K461DRAFT_313587 [Myriangium duriaei CBS 260.36]|uniref:Uncharacterized protein n=1 Tax=Myriangium duriaei CBS 260.36 TaxID=1168546 RepID=A0A9P4J3L4_9PEZI|nr:hypothetical protein K461DRAFT_313587 [Myriangium duriaei CBS 260.36]